jgi:hypothetical protein
LSKLQIAYVVLFWVLVGVRRVETKTRHGFVEVGHGGVVAIIVSKHDTVSRIIVVFNLGGVSEFDMLRLYAAWCRAEARFRGINSRSR